MINRFAYCLSFIAYIFVRATVLVAGSKVKGSVSFTSFLLSISCSTLSHETSLFCPRHCLLYFRSRAWKQAAPREITRLTQVSNREW